ncbi:MAG: hypothetical protein ACLFTH_03330 [Candidatus Woesearchaeota archaeon]
MVKTSDKVLKSVKNHFTILYVLLIAAVVLTGLQFAAVQQDASEGSWECVQTACAEYMSEGQIIDSVCTQVNGTYLCNVNVDGQPGQVPLEQLNLSSLRFCDEYVCVKEVNIRSANYTVNETVVSSIN